jgi:lipopolysaccharide transport system permease protein
VHAGPVPLRDLLRGLLANLDLLPLLARQHFQGQFRAARLGLAWSAIQPLIRGAVLAVIFTQVIPVETDVSYPAFVFAGTAVWSYLSNAITNGTTAISGTAALANKVYFPRLLLPAMPAAAQLPAYLINLGIVVLLVIAFGEAPGLTVLALPVAVLLGFAFVTAASAVLALLHVYYRDVGPLVAALVAVGFYATPVIYPPELVGDWRWLLDINPLTGALSAVRWSLFAGAESVGSAVWWTAGWTTLLAVVALAAYRRHDALCTDRL